MIRSFDPYDALFAGQPKVMVAKEVAGVLRMSHKTVHAWAKEGYMPSHRYRGCRRFFKSELIEWLRGHCGDAESRNKERPPLNRH